MIEPTRDLMQRTASTVETIPRYLAMWCSDCDRIFELQGPACPRCGSRDIASVARWLDTRRPCPHEG
jgi:rRNA maturation endonuclease Nob1